MSLENMTIQELEGVVTAILDDSVSDLSLVFTDTETVGLRGVEIVNSELIFRMSSPIAVLSLLPTHLPTHHPRAPNTVTCEINKKLDIAIFRSGLARWDTWSFFDIQRIEYKFEDGRPQSYPDVTPEYTDSTRKVLANGVTFFSIRFVKGDGSSFDPAFALRFLSLFNRNLRTLYLYFLQAHGLGVGYHPDPNDLARLSNPFQLSIEFIELFDLVAGQFLLDKLVSDEYLVLSRTIDVTRLHSAARTLYEQRDRYREVHKLSSIAQLSSTISDAALSEMNEIVCTVKVPEINRTIYVALFDAELYTIDLIHTRLDGTVKGKIESIKSNYVAFVNGGFFKSVFEEHGAFVGATKFRTTEDRAPPLNRNEYNNPFFARPFSVSQEPDVFSSRVFVDSQGKNLNIQAGMLDDELLTSSLVAFDATVLAFDATDAMSTTNNLVPKNDNFHKRQQNTPVDTAGMPFLGLATRTVLGIARKYIVLIIAEDKGDGKHTRQDALVEVNRIREILGISILVFTDGSDSTFFWYRDNFLHDLDSYRDRKDKSMPCFIGIIEKTRM